MSTIPEHTDDDVGAARPLRVRSVVGLAYDEIRALIVAGAFSPGDRVGQAELADQLGISRGSVREALRRLAGDGLVQFEVNRGFFVADVGLDAVLERLEVRVVLEPAIARLAADRRTDADLAAMRQAIALERAASTSGDAHDQSRAFHVAVAAATHNDAFVRTLDALWIADVGRRLLGTRWAAPTWRDEDVAEHEALLTAVADGDGDRAAELMRVHVDGALQHWLGRRRDGSPQ